MMFHCTHCEYINAKKTNVHQHRRRNHSDIAYVKESIVEIVDPPVNNLPIINTVHHHDQLPQQCPDVRNKVIALMCVIDDDLGA